MNKLKNIFLGVLAVSAFCVTACKKADTDARVTGIALDTMSLQLEVNDTYQFTATLEPLDAVNQEVSWTSSDRLVATVDQTGLLTATGVGETRVSATSIDGSFRTSCTVMVFPEVIPVTGIELEQTTAQVPMGGRVRLIPIITPVEATDKYLFWTQENPEIAIVTPSGVVEGMNAGTTRVFVTTRSGSFRDTCTVTVTPVMMIDQTQISIPSVALSSNFLTVTIPAAVADQTVVWTSDNPAIVEASGTGAKAQLVPKAVGEATITATSTDPAYAGGSSSVSCKVTVTPAVLEEVTLALGADLKGAMTANAGKIIVLPSGYTGAFNSASIPAGGIWIKGEANAAVKPKLTNAGLTLNGRTSGEIARFENVEIVGSGFTQGGYFINEGGSNNVDMGELSFINCRITEFGRSIVRFQGVTQRIGLLKFDNCVLENCSGQPSQDYYVIQSTVANLGFPDIRITNSTFSNVYVGIANVSGGSGQPAAGNLLIENSTFYKVTGSNSTPPNTGRYFIEAGNNGPVNITINNSIFGSVRGVGSENGIRMNAAGTLTGTNNYTTNDWVIVAGSQPPSATNYAGTCADLFAAPDAGDFHFKDGGFAGKSTAGDPRWR
jgi:uncharacterized protein YjdB